MTAQIQRTTGEIQNTTDRLEDTSLQILDNSVRTEQTLVVAVEENRVRLERLNGLMLRVQLKEQFGQGFMNRTVEIISSERSLFAFCC